MTHTPQRTLACRLTAIAAAILACTSALAQAHEHRSYYLDVTGSMSGFNGSPDIWNDVRDNLKNAINKVSDQTTTLEVVAWADQGYGTQTRMEKKATDSGKKALCDFIDGLKTSNNVSTEVWMPFEDFYRKHGNAQGETYFFLMTDGKTKSGSANKLDDAIAAWKNKTNERTYGFYVMLTSGAAAENIETAVENQNAQLWTVQTADVNIGQVKLRPTDYMVRERSGQIDVPIEYSNIPSDGDLTSYTISVSSDNPYFSVTGQQRTTADGKEFLRVFISPKVETMPEKFDIVLSAKANGLPNLCMLITKTVKVECINTPTPAVEISFKDKK